MRPFIRRFFITLIFCSFILLCNAMTNAQTTSFTYQGKLTDNQAAANGIYQMQFGLYDAQSGGNQIGTTQTNSAVNVTNGIFTVSLSFGTMAFDGAVRFLQISVFSSATNAFVPLTPRQAITSAPYAVRSLNAGLADTATNSTQLGGIAASQYVVTTDPRMTDSRNPLPGSNNYIRTDNSVQAADIYISGAMSANGYDSNFGYSISGSSVLTTPGSNNIFVGQGSGLANTSGNSNSLFGNSAGQANTIGSNNSFFGRNAGITNTTGNSNTVIGSNANVGSGNLSFATAIGANAIVSTSNTIILGRSLGQDTVKAPGVIDTNVQYSIGGSRVLSVAGVDNLFAGASAGAANSTGNSNAFFGRSAGQSNTTGNDNSFFGRSTGLSNTSGAFNTFVGSLTGDSNTTGNNNTFVGGAAGSANTNGNSNTFVGLQAGEGNTTGDQNAFFGVNAGNTNTTGNSNTYIGYNAKGAAGISNATAIGANAFVNLSNQIVIGTDSNIVLIPGGLSIDTLRISTLASAGITAVCRNALNDLSTCSSSLRYKTNIAPFNFGLNLINRLRPITFDWKDGGMKDLGLGAEDVAAIEPLLVTYNAKGEVEGVKYDRIGVVLLNAVKEQQILIQKQQEQIDLLKQLICLTNTQAEICKEKK